MGEKLEPGWQLGFTFSGGILLFFVFSFLKAINIIHWNWWIVCIPIMPIGLAFIIFFFMLLSLPWLEKSSKKSDEEGVKAKILLELKCKDPETLKRVTGSLNIFSNEYKKMNKQQLEEYIEEKKNEPRKKLVESRKQKLNRIFKAP